MIILEVFMSENEKNIYIADSEAEGCAIILRRFFEKYYRHLGEEISIAELGCGKGALLRYLGAAFPKAQIWGIDIDPKAVQIARTSMPSAQISKGSFTQTLWKDESIHIATSSLIFDYSELGNFEATYTFQELSRELYRVLTPGGTYVPASSDWQMIDDDEVIEAFQSSGFEFIDRGLSSSFGKSL
ncbi:MAG: class I SAM-dependent methyltransferase [Patescibacteria group bacterium]